MLSLIFRLLGILGSGASLIGLAVTLHPSGAPWTFAQVAALTLGAALLCMVAVLDALDHVRTSPKKFKSPSQIRDYMYDWISQDGKAVVFSNDLSWVNDEAMLQMLKRKAGRSELCICAPKQTQLLDNLRSEGAEIVCYSNLNHLPLSRFTIIRAGRGDAAVAIGRTIGQRHYIEEFAAGQNPVFWVASDLVEVLRRQMVT